jgi:hypothetical protein
MQFLKKHWATIAMIGSALMASTAEIQLYLETDKTPTLNELLPVIGFAVMGYLMKRPGDLTPKQAEERVQKAVRASALPDAP